MAFPIQTPFRNRSQTQSNIPYNTTPNFNKISTGWRTSENQSKWFLLVEYGKEFILDDSTGAEFDEDDQGGSLLVVLQSTVHQQLIQLLAHLQLPSPLGLSLHLIVPECKQEPKITDQIWSTFFSSYFSSQANQSRDNAFGVLPIAARVILKVDKNNARWYAGWIQGVRGDLMGQSINTIERRGMSNFKPYEGEVVDSQEEDDEGSQFTDSPYDLTVELLSPRMTSNLQQKVNESNSGYSDHSVGDTEVDKVETITLPPLSAFSSPLSPHSSPFSSSFPPQSQSCTQDSRSAVPLSFHSIPYSPLHTLPDSGALATQALLQDLYRNIEITKRGRSNSDLAKRRGKESLTVNTQIQEVKPPWADLGSSMWSVGTSWGPPSTVDGWDVSPGERKMKMEVQGEEEVRGEASMMSSSPILGQDSVLPELESDKTVMDNENDGHGNWIFLPKGQITPTPWKYGWPFHPVQNLPPKSPFPMRENLVAEEEVNITLKSEQKVDFRQDMPQIEGSTETEYSEASTKSIIFNVSSPITTEPHSPVEKDHLSSHYDNYLGDSDLHLQPGKQDFDPTSPFSPFHLDIPVSPYQAEDYEMEIESSQDDSGDTLDFSVMLEDEINNHNPIQSPIEVIQETSDSNSSSPSTQYSVGSTVSSSRVLARAPGEGHSSAYNTDISSSAMQSIHLAEVQQADKAIAITTHQNLYPNLIIDPPLPVRPDISRNNELTSVESISINLINFQYPNIIPYLSIIASSPTVDNTKQIPLIPILPHQSIYPNLLIYPCTSVISVYLTNYQYPNMVIYPCLDKGVKRIRSEIVNENIHEATKYPLESLSRSTTPPIRPSLKSRRSSSLKPALDDLDIPPSTVRKVNHHRGSSSISTITSTIITTPVSEHPLNRSFSHRSAKTTHTRDVFDSPALHTIDLASEAN